MRVLGNAGQVAFRKTDKSLKVPGSEVTIELIPYGCTTLRICEFPTRL